MNTDIMNELLKLTAYTAYIYVIAWVVFAAFFQHKLRFHRKVLKEIEDQNQGDKTK